MHGSCRFAAAALALLAMATASAAHSWHAGSRIDARGDTGPGPAGLLPLLEASGAVAGAGQPAWEAMVVSARLCPAPAALMVLAAGDSLVVLRGPTPHVLARGGLSLPSGLGAASGNVSWAGATVADLDGDGASELVLLASKRSAANGDCDAATGDIVVVSFAADCRSWHVAASFSVPAATAPAIQNWRGVAAGNFGGPATSAEAAEQLLLMGDASPQFVFVAASGVSGALQVTHAGDFGPEPGTFGDWAELGVGDMADATGANSTGAAGLLLVREKLPRVAALRWTNATAASVVATSDLPDVAAGTTTWIAAGVGSIFGDGRATALVVGVAGSGSTSTPVAHVLALNGSATLSLEAAHVLDEGEWQTAAIGPVLGASVLARPGEVQLVGLRTPSAQSANFPVNVLVYGRAEHYLSRRWAVSGTRSQYGFDSSMKMTVPVNTTVLRDGLTTTHANTYSAIVCDSAGGAPSESGYLAFVRILHDTASFAVDGEQLRVWLTLLPPTEAVGDKCATPPDSPLTPWNDTALFDESLGYMDYAAWANLCGRLAVMFPHFVALQIDDMSHDVQPPDGIFTPNLVANMTSGLRAHAPWMNLIPTTYYSEGSFVWDLWPDFPKVVDTSLFYFRNQKQGAGPCANPVCPWGPRMRSREGGCLAGACAEATAQNAAEEVAEVAAGFPAGRPLQVGFYATGHSSLGTPTARYVRMVMQDILQQREVAGITFYRMFVPPAGGCEGVNDDKGCVVAEVFGSLAAARGGVDERRRMMAESGKLGW